MHAPKRRSAGLVYAILAVTFATAGCEETTAPAAVETVAVEPAAPTVERGGTVTLSATARDRSGAILTGRAVEWSSSNQAVATVSPTGVVTGVGPGMTTVTATVAGVSATTNVSVRVSVASIRFVPTDSATITVGSTTTLRAVPFDNQGNPLLERRLTWSSNAPGVATVDSAGTVRGVGPGLALITASADGRTGLATVTVRIRPFRQCTQIATLRGDTTVAGALEGSDCAAPSDGFGGPLDYYEFTLTRPRTITARVSSSTFEPRVTLYDRAEGPIATAAPGPTERTTARLQVPLQPGTYVVAVQPAFGSSGRGNYQLSLTSGAPLGFLAVEPQSPTIRMGDTIRFRVIARDSAGNPLTDRIVNWTSSNFAVAPVTDPFGLVRGGSPGTATITATVEGRRATSTITVLSTVRSVGINPASARLLPGAFLQLQATPRDSAGNPVVNRPVTYTSSNPAVATVQSFSGIVNAVAPGEATITATSDERTGTATVTVYTSANAFNACETTLTPYTLGTSVSGSLSTTDCRRPSPNTFDNGYIDYYEFSVAATRLVSFQATGTFETQLILFDRAGRQITSTTGFPNAQLTRELAAGSYVIGVTSAFSVRTGSYTLSSTP